MDSDYTPDTPLVVKNIRKVYSNGKIPGKMAIKSVTFSVEKNTVFGILGSNGSGKSSLIGILTGLFEASSGCARLAGYDIKTETKFVYQNIGICPQFNILWEHLTVREHLLFYARVKGINSNLESTAIQDCLETVELDTMQSQLASDLSSGEKRRLAIAIALVGNPSVIFLDEPTVRTLFVKAVFIILTCPID